MTVALPRSIQRRFHRRASDLPLPAEPIRSELFSLERLEQHAQTLAHAQRVTLQSGWGRPFLRRVKDNARVLTRGYQAITHSVRDDPSATPAAEWFVDNFH